MYNWGTGSAPPSTREDRKANGCSVAERGLAETDPAPRETAQLIIPAGANGDEMHCELLFKGRASLSVICETVEPGAPPAMGDAVRPEVVRYDGFSASAKQEFAADIPASQMIRIPANKAHVAFTSRHNNAVSGCAGGWIGVGDFLSHFRGTLASKDAGKVIPEARGRLIADPGVSRYED